MSFRHRSAALAVGGVLMLSGSAQALTAGQIEAGARRAPVGVRETTARLASDAFQGRNNLTEGSIHDPAVRKAALAKARANGYLGAE